MKGKQNIFLGIILGIAIPFMLVGVINIGLVLYGKYLTSSIFESTLLLGVGLNALAIKLIFKKNKDYIARGLMISSLLIFVYWVIKFV